MQYNERKNFSKKKKKNQSKEIPKIKNVARGNEKSIVKEKNYDDQIEGRNAVLELLESNKDINKIYITAGEKRGSINKIIAMAKEKKIIIVEKEKRQMDIMAGTENYQGVIAIVPPYEYVDVPDILDEAKKRNEDPFIRWNRRYT